MVRIKLSRSHIALLLVVIGFLPVLIDFNAQIQNPPPSNDILPSLAKVEAYLTDSDPSHDWNLFGQFWLKNITTSGGPINLVILDYDREPMLTLNNITEIVGVKMEIGASGSRWLVVNRISNDTQVTLFFWDGIIPDHMPSIRTLTLNPILFTFGIILSSIALVIVFLEGKRFADMRTKFYQRHLLLLPVTIVTLILLTPSLVFPFVGLHNYEYQTVGLRWDYERYQLAAPAYNIMITDIGNEIPEDTWYSVIISIQTVDIVPVEVNISNQESGEIITDIESTVNYTLRFILESNQKKLYSVSVASEEELEVLVDVQIAARILQPPIDLIVLGLCLVMGTVLLVLVVVSLQRFEKMTTYVNVADRESSLSVNQS